MPLNVIRKTNLPTARLLLRLNASDTEFLLSRINQAVMAGVGVNLILHDLNSAICEIETPEQGRQIAINAYSTNMTLRIESPMRGYIGQWSHVEIVMPLRAIQPLAKFATDGGG